MKADFNRSLMSLDVPVSGRNPWYSPPQIIDGWPGRFKIVKVAYIKYPGRQKAMLGEIP
jgi:hypothetical protein